MNNLSFDINSLRNRIPKKPDKFTLDIPHSIEESLSKYLNKSTISNIQEASYIHDYFGWAMPLYIDPNNIKIGFRNKVILAKTNGLYGRFKYWDIFSKLEISQFKPHSIEDNILTRTFLAFHRIKKIKYFDWFLIPILCTSFKITNFSELMIDLLDENFNFYKKKILHNHYLNAKQIALGDIFQTYKSGNFAACITTIYPIIDFIIREILGISLITKGVGVINKSLEKIKFDLENVDNLKPGAFTEKYLNIHSFKSFDKDSFKKLSDKNEYNLGFPGIALSSFLYYSQNIIQIIKMGLHNLVC